MNKKKSKYTVAFRCAKVVYLIAVIKKIETMFLFRSFVEIEGWNVGLLAQKLARRKNQSNQIIH